MIANNTYDAKILMRERDEDYLETLLEDKNACDILKKKGSAKILVETSDVKKYGSRFLTLFLRSNEIDRFGLPVAIVDYCCEVH